MPTFELSARGIESLRIPEESDKQADYNDARVPGLSLRVFASGRRGWYFRYRAGRTKRRMKLGDYPALGLSEARKRAERLRLEVRDGRDPLRLRRVRDEADTVADLVQAYLPEYAEEHLAPKTLTERKRILGGKDVGIIANLIAGEIQPGDVAAVLDRIEKRGSRVMLNRTQEALSAMFNWAAIRRRMGVVQNPVKSLPRRFPAQSRTRVLDAAEIRAVWTDLERRQLGAAVPLRLVLLTAQRPGEVAAMQWAHVDLDAGLWRMPEGYRKKPRGERFAPAHDVPLPDLAVELLHAAKTLGGRRYVFPSTAKAGHLHYSGLTQAADRVVRHLKMDPWTPHDLRRTAATHMTRIGVDRHVVNRVLGHKDPTVLGIYDRHDYARDRHDALVRWTKELRSINMGERQRR